MSPDKARDRMPPSSVPASGQSAPGGPGGRDPGDVRGVRGAARRTSEKPAASDLLGTYGRPARPGRRDRLQALVRRRPTALAAAVAVVATLVVVAAAATGQLPRLLVVCLVVVLAVAAWRWGPRVRRAREAARELAARREPADPVPAGAPEAASPEPMQTRAAVTEAVPTAAVGADQGEAPVVLELRRIVTRGRLSKRAALTAAAAVCRDVDNPGARALRAGAELARLEVPAVTALTMHPDGASAVIKDTEVAVGWPSLFGSVDDALLRELGDDSGRRVLVGWDGEAHAAFLLVPAS